MKIKGRLLRDGGALSGLQLGLVAAEHRPSSPLIWMSTRRLVLCLPASLCALPPATACQQIALAALWPPPAMPRSLINILRWRPISRNAAGRTNGVHRSRRPHAVYRQKTEKFDDAFGETAIAVQPSRSVSAASKAGAGVADSARASRDPDSRRRRCHDCFCPRQRGNQQKQNVSCSQLK